MSEETLVHPTDAIVPVESSHPSPPEARLSSETRLDELSRILLDFKLTSDQRLDTLEEKLRRSQRQVGFLRAGWLLTLLGLGGGLLVLTFWFRLEQLRLQGQVSGIAAYTGPDSEVVQRLDATQAELEQLQQRLPENLTERLTTSETQLAEVTENLATLTQQQAQRRDVVSVLTEALQAIVADGTAENAAQMKPESEPEPESEPDTEDSSN